MFACGVIIMSRARALVRAARSREAARASVSHRASTCADPAAAHHVLLRQRPACVIVARGGLWVGMSAVDLHEVHTAAKPLPGILTRSCLRSTRRHQTHRMLAWQAVASCRCAVAVAVDEPLTTTSRSASDHQLPLPRRWHGRCTGIGCAGPASTTYGGRE